MGHDEKTQWNRRFSEGSHQSVQPDSFLVKAYSEFMASSKPGRALDVAGGAGRHALWLAEQGWQVELIDISDVAIELARKNIASRLNGVLTHSPIAKRIVTRIQDLETGASLAEEAYDLILVFFYLERSLFPALISALRPGGVLLYKTYTLEQLRFGGGPRHPMHLLKPNELLQAFCSLRVLHYHETIHDRGVAELVATKDGLATNSRESREFIPS